jgi:RalA-binding protein 1
MEAVMNQQRPGGGTPPPIIMDHQLRATPTPPPTYAVPAVPTPRQTTYEPNFLAQQVGSHVSLRPAYESGFVLPPGFDPAQFSAAPMRTNPGYDRPIYENDYNNSGVAAYDQPYARRRESAVFMGSGVVLNQKPSQSRLREETRL